MEPINLADVEEQARARLEPGASGSFAGGADDEVTLRDNLAAFRRWQIVPRVLVDVSEVETETAVLGQPIALPVLLAPVAFQSLAHPDGELAAARAAAAPGTILVASTLSSFRLEEIAAAAAGPKWFQLYCYRDRRVTERLVERAEAHQYRAICLTVDAPRLGNRERDRRNRFALPAAVRPRNFEEFVDGRVLDLLKDEFSLAPGLAGCPSARQIGRALVRRAPPS